MKTKHLLITTLIALATTLLAKASPPHTPNIFGGSVGIAPLNSPGVGVSAGLSYDRYLLKWFAIGANIQFDYQNQFPPYANIEQSVAIDEQLYNNLNDPGFKGYRRAGIFAATVNLKFAPLNTPRSLLFLGVGAGVRTVNTTNLFTTFTGCQLGQTTLVQGVYNVQIEYDYKLPKRWLIGLNVKMQGAFSSKITSGFSSTYFTPSIVVGRRF